jgi:hypothetical protein
VANGDARAHRPDVGETRRARDANILGRVVCSRQGRAENVSASSLLPRRLPLRRAHSSPRSSAVAGSMGASRRLGADSDACESSPVMANARPPSIEGTRWLAGWRSPDHESDHPGIGIRTGRGSCSPNLHHAARDRYRGQQPCTWGVGIVVRRLRAESQRRPPQPLARTAIFSSPVKRILRRIRTRIPRRPARTSRRARALRHINSDSERPSLTARFQTRRD